MRRLATLICLCLIAGTALATPDQLADVEAELEQARQDQALLAAEAEALGESLSDVQSRMVTVGQRLKNLETELLDLQAERDRLRADRDRWHAALATQRDQIAATAAALARLSMRPQAALLTAPGAPIDALHSSLLLRAALPEVERRSRALRDDLDGLAQALTALDAREQDLADTAAELAVERATLEELLATKRNRSGDASAAARAAAARLDALSARAQDLRDLAAEVERLSALAPRPSAKPAARRAAKAKASARASSPGPIGRMTPPAAGHPIRGFGDADPTGAPSQGLTLAMNPGGVVVAPEAGTVRFAGPFRGYGLLVIVDHGDGRHSLLAGLGRIDTRIGAQVLAGEPLGRAKETRALDSAASAPELYFELRRNGEPIDPAPILAAIPG